MNSRTDESISSSFLFEGDIKLGSPERNGIVSPSGFRRWPKAQIPYVISTNYSTIHQSTIHRPFINSLSIKIAEAERKVIGSAINEYHKKTCIRFVARRNETDYVIITKTGEG